MSFVVVENYCSLFFKIIYFFYLNYLHRKIGRKNVLGNICDVAIPDPLIRRTDVCCESCVTPIIFKRHNITYEF